jgi:cysteine desulfurase
MTQKTAYMDYAAATMVDPRVQKVIRKYEGFGFGNSMSMHNWGRVANEAIGKARKTLAGFIGAEAEEIIFTSSATESNNLALKGWMDSRADKKHIILSAIEHKCVMESANFLKKKGYEISLLPVDEEGEVKLKELKKMIRPDTLLVSVMAVNNEVGTIEPIEEIGRICKRKKVMFHCDAVQAFGKMKIDVERQGIDMLTLSSHKIYGPKGVGLLYVRKEIKLGLEPLMHGGGQEEGKRSSTMNVAGIVGMAKAAELMMKNRVGETKRLAKLKKRFMKGVKTALSGVKINGKTDKCVSNILNLSFAKVEGEAILMMLDDRGVMVSTGSACSADDLRPSYVLLAMGKTIVEAHGSIRFSWGRWTNESEIDYAVKAVTESINKLRHLSPFSNA